MKTASLVFLDESGVNTDMTRLYARADGGARAVDSAPLNTPTNTTIISSVRTDGDFAYTTFSGANNGERFKEYLKNNLIPTLKSGDVVVMDNSKAHKVDGVKTLIESVGATVLYLLPYSPDLNPIEQMWSKIKAFLRKIKVRSVDKLFYSIPDAFRQVFIDDISGCFINSGYCL